MQKKRFKTNGVCAKEIEFDYVDNKVYNVKFIGGCQGNLKALSALLDGLEFDKICTLLEGNICGVRDTSCTDQLTKAIKELK